MNTYEIGIIYSHGEFSDDDCIIVVASSFNDAEIKAQKYLNPDEIVNRIKQI